MTHLSKEDFKEYSDITDAAGQVTFQWSKAPRRTYEELVTDIKHSSFNYDPSLDVDNLDYYTH